MYGYSMWTGRSAIDVDQLAGTRPGAELGTFIADLPAWMDEAVCAQTDPEEFFPTVGISAAAAKQVCRSCPVQADCLDYAVTHGERFGIWGGLTERERRRLRRGAA